ncbi:MAG: RNA pseudouridine synthase [Bacteroides sp.]|nr:RNA pseudouridine synthase [Bacteroides sp.]
MIHYFPNDIHDIALPTLFTYPFRYTPHPLSKLAAEEVQAYLQSRTDWHEELQQGKMFGVLVVKDTQGKIGFLAAFSGNLAGSNLHPYFVPPVYDLLNPDGYFKEEEEQISAINRQLKELEASSYSPQSLAQKTLQLQAEAQAAIQEQKQAMKEAQQKRNELRQSGTLTEEELEALIKQSQAEKTKLKRIKNSWKDYIQQQINLYTPWIDQIDALKEERKKRSAALQQWIFQQFRMRNALGEEKDLFEIFDQTFQQLPPAGTGECAAPKLLQYAYREGLKPIAMAEFWWGDSPKGEIRRHGQYYPACKHKCEPVLTFMLQGLKVEPNPLLCTNTDANQLIIIYEDEHLLVVNKPAGMLSVPGKNGQASVQSMLEEQYPEASGLLLVHRLDMDTSGLLVVAKDKQTHALIQEQFEKRLVQKRYIALLEGIPTNKSNKGSIHLPMRPDYDNCPLQIVDHLNGKNATTRYEIREECTHLIEGKEHACTRIVYYPETGRTHQLRVHSAHPDGMDCPILGDPLYGQSADRMYLHAESIQFQHPWTSQEMKFIQEAPF